MFIHRMLFSHGSSGNLSQHHARMEGRGWGGVRRVIPNKKLTCKETKLVNSLNSVGGGDVVTSLLFVPSGIHILTM